MDNVLCPWCWSEMKFYDDGDVAYMFCPECSARSPRVIPVRDAVCEYPEATRIETVKAALRRPLQKPLTLEEACKSNEPCVYLEQKGFAPIIAANLCYSIYGYYGENFEVEKIGVPKEIYCSDEYGTKLRCWATKPTQEEREAAKWE